MKKKKSWVSALTLIDQVAISMLVPIIGCILVGAWLDKITGFSPLWLILFVLLGVGAGFRNVYHMIMKQCKKGNKDDT